MESFWRRHTAELIVKDFYDFTSNCHVGEGLTCQQPPG